MALCELTARTMVYRVVMNALELSGLRLLLTLLLSTFKVTRGLDRFCDVARVS